MPPVRKLRLCDNDIENENTGRHFKTTTTMQCVTLSLWAFNIDFSSLLCRVSFALKSGMMPLMQRQLVGYNVDVSVPSDTIFSSWHAAEVEGKILLSAWNFIPFFVPYIKFHFGARSDSHRRYVLCETLSDTDDSKRERYFGFWIINRVSMFSCDMSMFIKATRWKSINFDWKFKKPKRQRRHEKKDLIICQNQHFTQFHAILIPGLDWY